MYGTALNNRLFPIQDRRSSLQSGNTFCLSVVNESEDIYYISSYLNSEKSPVCKRESRWGESHKRDARKIRYSLLINEGRKKNRSYFIGKNIYSKIMTAKENEWNEQRNKQKIS